MMTLMVTPAMASQPGDIDRRVEDLLGEMTLAEKAGQMTQLTLQYISSGEEGVDSEHELDMDRVREVIVDKHVGSVLNTYNAAFTPEYWREEVVGPIQRVAMEETRLGIPIIYGIDSVHGANYVKGATLFPQNLTLGATFNTELSREAGRHTAIDTRACGLPWNFSPVADLGRQPLWSRIFETFGEDPMHAGAMAAANIEGQQGDDLSSYRSVAACAKHFLGYSVPWSGKDRTPAYIGEIQLRDTHLPPFRDAVEAGVATVMVNSGEVDGVPVHASRKLLTDMLRGELGFEGVVVTDWADIKTLHERHRVAANEKEATRQAVLAGIDVSMVPLDTSFADYVVELVEEGALSESRIDQSVRRVLRLKFELGLFDDPLGPGSLVEDVGSDEADAASLESAREGLVLLRNADDLLPISEGSKILVTGPTADALTPVYGSWSYTWQGDEPKLYPDTPTVLDEIRDRFGRANVTYSAGATLTEGVNIEATARKAEEADVVVLCLGEEASTEKPGDIVDLGMPPAQIDLARAVLETGTPVVLVLIENRPRIFNEVQAGVEAILWAGQPGPFGPQAIAEVLAGDVNPSGKLPFTYPRHPGSLITYDRKTTEDYAVDFSMNAFTPLFEFGDGLSYTTFEYEDLNVRQAGGGLEASVTVRNTGDRAGKEAVLAFVRDEYASVTPHHRRLKAFEKIELEPGASRRVTFDIPREDLTLINRDLERVFEPGAFTVEVGDQSAQIELR